MQRRAPSNRKATASASTLPVDRLWYKDAVIYQLHVRSLLRQQQRRHRRFRRPDAEARLSARPGRDGHLAVAVLSLAAPRRRLRHRRLHRGQSVIRRSARLQGVRPRGPRPRPAGDHRVGAQSHLGPASLVSARPPGEARHRRLATFTCGATRRRSTPTRGSSSRISRFRIGPGTRWPRPTTGIASIRTSPT